MGGFFCLVFGTQYFGVGYFACCPKHVNKRFVYA